MIVMTFKEYASEIGKNTRGLISYLKENDYLTPQNRVAKDYKGLIFKNDNGEWCLKGKLIKELDNDIRPDWVEKQKKKKLRDKQKEQERLEKEAEEKRKERLRKKKQKEKSETPKSKLRQKLDKLNKSNEELDKKKIETKKKLETKINIPKLKYNLVDKDDSGENGKPLDSFKEKDKSEYKDLSKIKIDVNHTEFSPIEKKKLEKGEFKVSSALEGLASKVLISNEHMRLSVKIEKFIDEEEDSIYFVGSFIFDKQVYGEKIYKNTFDELIKAIAKKYSDVYTDIKVKLDSMENKVIADLENDDRIFNVYINGKPRYKGTIKHLIDKGFPIEKKYKGKTTTNIAFKTKSGDEVVISDK